MNLSSIPILATAISVIIAWALFAIFCSLIHEAVVQMKSERGKFLKFYLEQQLEDVPNGINWGSMIYLHGSIDLLSRAVNKPPRCISPKIFSEAFIDVVAKAQLVEMAKQKLDEASLTPKYKLYKSELLNNFKAATMALKPSDVNMFLTQALESAELKATKANGVVSEDEVYNNLLSNVQAWYKEMQDRLAIWYQKKTRVRLFILGVLLGLLINVDSLQLFRHLDENASSRQVLMSYYENNIESLERLAAQNGGDSSAYKTLVQYKGSMDSLILKSQLPVGFDHSVFKKPVSGFGWFSKLLGILVSGFAASFGAPFWFELLKKAYRVKK